MRFQKPRTYLVLLCAIFLVACGGSSGGRSNESSNESANESALNDPPDQNSNLDVDDPTDPTEPTEPTELNPVTAEPPQNDQTPGPTGIVDDGSTAEVGSEAAIANATLYSFSETRGSISHSVRDFHINKNDDVAFTGSVRVDGESRQVLYMGDITNTSPVLEKFDAVPGVDGSIRIDWIRDIALDDNGDVTALVSLAGSRDETGVLEIAKDGTVTMIAWGGQSLIDPTGEARKILNVSNVSRNNGTTSFIAEIEDGNIGHGVAVEYKKKVLTVIAETEYSPSIDYFFQPENQPTLNGCSFYLRNSYEGSLKTVPGGIIFQPSFKDDCKNDVNGSIIYVFYNGSEFSAFAPFTGKLDGLTDSSYSMTQLLATYENGSSVYRGTAIDRTIPENTGFFARSEVAFFAVSPERDVTPIVIAGESVDAVLGTEELEFGFREDMGLDSLGYYALSKSLSDESFIAVAPTRAKVPYSTFADRGDSDLTIVASSAGTVPEPFTADDFFNDFYDFAVLPDGRVAFIANVDNPLETFTLGNGLWVGSSLDNLQTILTSADSVVNGDGDIVSGISYLGRDATISVDAKGALTIVMGGFSSVSVLKVQMP